MDKLPKKFYFEPHLQLLYNSFSVLGIIPFKFNYSTKRFEPSRIRDILATVAYNLVRWMYGFAVITKFAELLSEYVHTKTVEYGFSSVKAQDHFLAECCMAREYVSALIYVFSYFRMRHILLPTLNEIVDIYHAIRRRPSLSLYVDAALVKILFMRLCITCCRLRIRVISSLVITVLYYDVVWIFGTLIPELIFASYVYCQLFLTSVYLRLHEELAAAADSGADRRRLRRSIRKLTALSHRIHCVKQTLNELYKPVYLDTMFGALFDINNVYVSLKVLFYYKYSKSDHNTWNWLVRMEFPACISYTFDAYLIGLLSDGLIQSEKDFRTRLMTVSNSRMMGHRQVELTLLQSKTHGLGPVLYGDLSLDQQFAFDYAINIVLNFALTCLQFYAGEEVYATNSTLTVSQEAA